MRYSQPMARHIRHNHIHWTVEELAPALHRDDVLPLVDRKCSRRPHSGHLHWAVDWKGEVARGGSVVQKGA